MAYEIVYGKEGKSDYMVLTLDENIKRLTWREIMSSEDSFVIESGQSLTSNTPPNEDSASSKRDYLEEHKMRIALFKAIKELTQDLNECVEALIRPHIEIETNLRGTSAEKNKAK